MFSYTANPLATRWAPTRPNVIQMQHDSEFTLDEVFDEFPRGTYSVTQSVSSPHEVNTRFLRVPPLDLSLGFPSEIVCSLTQKGECIGVKDYLAVSYCWDSFPSQAERTFKISIDDGRRRREPRCPLRVLRRAIDFAILHKVELIWIDQESIDQSDASDIEEHMQCMHLIFEEAEHVIGLLSFEISTPKQCLSFIALEFASVRLAERIDTFMDVNMIDHATRLMRSISKDRWFSRTWVYQERFSSVNKMKLLFPVSSRVKEGLRNSQNKDFGEDLAIEARALILAPIEWAISLENFVPHKLDAESAHHLRDRLKVLYKTMQKLEIGHLSFEDRFDIHVSNATIPPNKEPWAGFGLSAIFRDIESCDNRVVSDRIAIFANVAKLEHRVRTTDYRSYSVALLFQLLQNKKFPMVLVQLVESHGGTFSFGAQDISLTTLLDEFMLVSAVLRKREKKFENDLPEHCEVLRRIIRARAPEGLFERAFESEISYPMQIAVLLSGDVQWMRDTLPDLKIAIIVPTTATIGEILDCIAAVDNDAAEMTEHDLGHWIVDYGIKKGQVPPGTEFVSFFGEWRWRYDFIEKHFMMDRAAGSRALLHADALHKASLHGRSLAQEDE